MITFYFFFFFLQLVKLEVQQAILNSWRSFYLIPKCGKVCIKMLYICLLKLSVYEIICTKMLAFLFTCHIRITRKLQRQSQKVQVTFWSGSVQIRSVCRSYIEICIKVLNIHAASPEPEEDVEHVEGEERRRRPLGLQSMLGWKPSWRRACLVRWSLRMKHLVQRGQAKRFSPVCVRKWRVSSSEREKRLLQLGHVHWNGLSPKDKERERKSEKEI